MIPDCRFSCGSGNVMALAVEKFENHYREFVQPDFYLRIKTYFGSIHTYPIRITDIKGGCSGYEWDTGCEWQRTEEQEGANLRIPLRTYTLEKWEAYVAVFAIGLYIIWRNFEYEMDFDLPFQIEAGLQIAVSYHLSSDENPGLLF